jgi:hypothetical protein
MTDSEFQRVGAGRRVTGRRPYRGRNSAPEELHAEHSPARANLGQAGPASFPNARTSVLRGFASQNVIFMRDQQLSSNPPAFSKARAT